MPILPTASQVRPSSGFATCCTSHCIDCSSQFHAIHFWAILKRTGPNIPSSLLSVPPSVVINMGKMWMSYRLVIRFRSLRTVNIPSYCGLLDYATAYSSQYYDDAGSYTLAKTWLPSTALEGVIIHNQRRRKPKLHPDDQKIRPTSVGGGVKLSLCLSN
jgi:hypothetical protein